MRSLVENHPAILAKAKGVNSAEQGIRTARAGHMPTVKLGGDEGYEYIDSPDRRLTQGRHYSNTRNTANLTVTQKIFEGFATDSLVESAKISRQISEVDLRAVRQTTLLEGTVAYLDVMRQTKLVALSRETERKIHEQLNLEDERVQKGSGIASDVLNAKQRLHIAKSKRLTYEGAFQTAVAKYTRLFGHAPNVAALSDPPLPLDLIPPSIDDSVDTAEKDNPTLESASRNTELTSEKRRYAEAGYWPTLDLVAKADYENGKNGTIGPRRDWSMLLVANWELFSGFKTQASVAQASWDHAASKDSRMDVSRKVSGTIRETWHRLQTARQRLDLLDNAAILAEELWEATKKKHEAGKATIQEVLDDEAKINDARVEYTNAYYDIYQAVFELLAGMGRLEVESLARAKPAVSRDMTPHREPEPKAAQQPAAKPKAASPAVSAAQPPVRPILASAAAVRPEIVAAESDLRAKAGEHYQNRLSQSDAATAKEAMPVPKANIPDEFWTVRAR